jgi:crossover junction endodeoxyribonuclease RusA
VSADREGAGGVYSRGKARAGCRRELRYERRNAAPQIERQGGETVERFPLRSPAMHLEVAISGVPATLQSKGWRRTIWKTSVASEATKTGCQPLVGAVRLRIIYFYAGQALDRDIDNIIKPIQDALIGIAYADDRQVVDVHATACDQNGVYVLHRIPWFLGTALGVGLDFVYLSVDPADPQTPLI